MGAKTRQRKGSKPTPKQRLAQALREARAKGVKPITDFDKYLDEVGDVWPEDENIEDFLAWLYKGRRTGKYE
jgi:hypothetical protein